MEQLFKRYINNHAIRVDQTKAFGYKDQNARNRLGKFAVYRVLVDRGTLIAHIRSDDIGFLFYNDRKTTAQWAAMFNQKGFDLPEVPSYSTLYTIYEWVMNYEPNFFLIPEPKIPSTEVRKVAPQPVDDPQEEIDAFNQDVGRLSEEDKKDPYLSAEFNKTGLDLRMRRAKFVAYKKEIEETSAYNDGVNARNRQKMEQYEREKKAFDDQKKIYWGIAKYVEFVVKERLRLSRGDGILENSLPTITDFDIAESTRNQKLREQMEAKMGPKELSRTMVPAPLPTRPGEEPYVFVPRVEKPATYLPAPMPIEAGCHKKIKICDEEVKMGDHHPPPPPPPVQETKEPDSPPPKKKDSIIPPPKREPFDPIIEELKRSEIALKPTVKLDYYEKGLNPFQRSDVASTWTYQICFGNFQNFIQFIQYHENATNHLKYYFSQLVSLWLFHFKESMQETFDIELSKENVEYLHYRVLEALIGRSGDNELLKKRKDEDLKLDYKRVLDNPMYSEDLKNFLFHEKKESINPFLFVVFGMCFFDLSEEFRNKFGDVIVSAFKIYENDSYIKKARKFDIDDPNYIVLVSNLLLHKIQRLKETQKDNAYYNITDNSTIFDEWQEKLLNFMNHVDAHKQKTKIPIYDEDAWTMEEMLGVREEVYLAADI